MVVREITVVKRPRNDKIEDRPISFPPLQNLHLNLMENKKKLKKNLPIVQIKKQPPKPDELNVKPYTPDMMAGKTPVNVIKKAGGAAASTAKPPQKSKEEGGDAKPKKERREDGDAKPKKERREDGDAKPKKDRKVDGDAKPKKDRKKDGEESKKERKKERSKKKVEDHSEEASEDAKEEHNEPSEEASEDAKEEHNEPSEVDDLADELGEGDAEDAVNKGADGASVADAGGDAPAEAEDDDPYAGLSPEERERQEREEYIWRFKIMKKKYRNRNIPEFNEHDDLEMMKMTYQRSLKEISLDENVESYRMYLQFGFMGMEYVATQWLGIDLTGFAKQQMSAMHKYDSLLIELGEKSQNRWLSNLPVEIRLIGFIIIQAGIFYVGKMIAGNVNEGVADFFRGMMGQGSSPPAASAPGPAGAGGATEPKRKMRGPSIKAEDIKKMKEPEV
jgi:hypothetical protein